ncbi:glycosyltransferase family A protein [Flavobacterium sp.]|uniref:glycosyltransferase family 2 protein n=1 Tax=Flavobacterium sp. TaxID=239 RepID=UPI00286DADCB|nr:glycosyltransferase family A protein [Flavobacterium sp.]
MDIIEKIVISIIIPTYKRTDYLKLTLQSVLNQTFQSFEIIVVDDGSPTDENEKICSQYAKIKYIKIKNSGGPAKPRNIGIKAAKGKYIAFVDDDDIWLPTKLEKQVAILEQNPDFGLVHSCCELIDEKGITKNEIIGRPGTPDVKHGDVSMRMMGNWTVMMPTPLVRKEVLDKVGFFNEEMPPAGEDVEYWTRTSFYTKFYYLVEPLVQYRVHSNNISNEKAKYLQLPLYLKFVLKQQLELKRIDKKQFQLLFNNLCKMQIRTIKTSFFKTIKYLFILDFFWIFKFNNIKMMIYILFIKNTH